MRCGVCQRLLCDNCSGEASFGTANWQRMAPKRIVRLCTFEILDSMLLGFTARIPLSALHISNSAQCSGVSLCRGPGRLCIVRFPSESPRQRNQDEQFIRLNCLFGVRGAVQYFIPIPISNDETDPFFFLFLLVKRRTVALRLSGAQPTRRAHAARWTRRRSRAQKWATARCRPQPSRYEPWRGAPPAQ